MDDLDDLTPAELRLIGQPAPGDPVPHLDFPPDPALAAQGWQRRFTAEPFRAQEAERLYTELGFEVHLAPIQLTELSELCGDCGLETSRAYVTIYTRRPSRGP